MRFRSVLSLARTVSTRAFPAEKAIYEKLTVKFEPSQLQVQDVSGIRVHDSLHMSPLNFIRWMWNVLCNSNSEQ